MASMWNADSDYDHDVACGNEDRWGGIRCAACNADITEYADNCGGICAACEEELIESLTTPKTPIVRAAAEAAGIPVVEITVEDVATEDILGLPKRNA